MEHKFYDCLTSVTRINYDTGLSVCLSVCLWTVDKDAQYFQVTSGNKEFIIERENKNKRNQKKKYFFMLEINF